MVTNSADCVIESSSSRLCRPCADSVKVSVIAHDGDLINCCAFVSTQRIAALDCAPLEPEYFGYRTGKAETLFQTASGGKAALRSRTGAPP